MRLKPQSTVAGALYWTLVGFIAGVLAVIVFGALSKTHQPLSDEQLDALARNQR